MANTFKKVIDTLIWRQVSPTPNAQAAELDARVKAFQSKVAALTA